MILYILATQPVLEFKNELQYCVFIRKQVSKKINLILMYWDTGEYTL